MKTGQKIRTTSGAEQFFFEGDVGIVVEDTGEDLFVDFNNQGNPHVDCDGYWYVGYDQAEAI